MSVIASAVRQWLFESDERLSFRDVGYDRVRPPDACSCPKPMNLHYIEIDPEVIAELPNWS